MSSDELARLDIVGGDDGVRATRAGVDRHHRDARGPNGRDTRRNLLGVDRVEDHSVGSRGCKRPELFKLTLERLARIEHRDLHAGGGAGCLDRVRFRMKERIGEVLNDKGDCLQARRMIELSGGEFGDADPDPISSVRVAPQQAFPHQGLADVEQAALRRPQAPGDVG